MKDDLERVRRWADEKIASGAEPPWAWYRYMQLRESLDAILAGMATVTPPTANLQPQEPHLGNVTRLVVSRVPQDTAQRHQDTEPVQLPT